MKFPVLWVVLTHSDSLTSSKQCYLLLNIRTSCTLVHHPLLPTEFAFKVIDLRAQRTTFVDAAAQKRKKERKTAAKTECHLLDVEKVALPTCFYCIELQFSVYGNWQATMKTLTSFRVEIIEST